MRDVRLAHGAVVGKDAGHLDNADTCKEKVDSRQEDIPRFDDRTPPCPYRAGCEESNVLRQRELFRRSIEVRDARYDKSSLHNRSPAQCLLT